MKTASPDSDDDDPSADHGIGRVRVDHGQLGLCGPCGSEGEGRLGRADQSSRLDRSRRRQVGGADQHAGAGREATAGAGQVGGVLEAVGDRGVGADGRLGRVPRLELHQPELAGCLGESPVHAPTVAARGGVVHGRAHQRVPEPHHVAQLDQAGRLGAVLDVAVEGQQPRGRADQVDLAGRVGRGQQDPDLDDGSAVPHLTYVVSLEVVPDRDGVVPERQVGPGVVTRAPAPGRSGRAGCRPSPGRSGRRRRGRPVQRGCGRVAGPLRRAPGRRAAGRVRRSAGSSHRPRPGPPAASRPARPRSGGRRRPARRGSPGRGGGRRRRRRRPGRSAPAAASRPSTPSPTRKRSGAGPDPPPATSQGLALPIRQCRQVLPQRDDEPLDRRERHRRLGLVTGEGDDPHAGGGRARVVEEGGLADTRLTDHQQRAALRRCGRGRGAGRGCAARPPARRAGRRPPTTWVTWSAHRRVPRRLLSVPIDPGGPS